MLKARAVKAWIDEDIAGCVVCRESAPDNENPTTWARKHVEANEGHATAVSRRYAYSTNPAMTAPNARTVKRLDGK